MTQDRRVHEADHRGRRLIGIFWLIALLLGAFQAWDYRHVMNPDGMSYLDMGDAYFRGDWNMTVNAYWSPFYSWLLGLAMVVLKPSPFWEFSVVRLVNLAIYLCALGCFHFFLVELIRYHQGANAGFSANRGVGLPEWVWIALGYTVFIWSSVKLITIWMVTPDLCVSAFVYLASGILLRIRMGSHGWLTFILLGLVLGFSYMAKAAMFPLSFVFLMVGLFLVGDFRKAVPRVLVSLFVFLLLASPFIALLSNDKGRLTFGDSGKLVYSWVLNGTAYPVHWQGDPPGSGTPRHPTRKIFDAPPLYEFARPIGGTYPPWYDPSYWYEGVLIHFNVKEQMSALHTNVMFYVRIFKMQSGLIVGTLILYLAGGIRWGRMKDVARHWNLLIPAVAAFSMYALVDVSGRYIGPFVVLLWMAVFSGIRIPDAQDSRRLVRFVTIAVLTVMAAEMCLSPTLMAASRARQLIAGENPWPHVHWEVADGLKEMGVQSGDKVASLGNGLAAYWARLARVQIVTEIRSGDVSRFWAADRSIKLQVIDMFKSTGAKIVVANTAPCDFTDVGWREVGNTGYYAYALSRDVRAADGHLASDDPYAKQE